MEILLRPAKPAIENAKSTKYEDAKSAKERFTRT